MQTELSRILFKILKKVKFSCTKKRAFIKRYSKVLCGSKLLSPSYWLQSFTPMYSIICRIFIETCSK